jgi:outer membrane biosynthesis protein TonB
MGETRAAIIKHKPLPEYTQSAHVNRIEGKIVLKMVLSASGEVETSRLLKGYLSD